jgi:hypothetical protein
MINMILQKSLPIIIRCSELRRAGELKFEVLKLTEIANQQTINVFATKPPRRKGSQSCTIDFAALAN